MNESQQGAPSGRPRWLLALGAATGLALATAGILQRAPGASALPDHAAAVVNGSVIRESHYQRALAAFESDRRSPLTPEDRSHVLDRLIEEELLVQRAAELGLDRSDPVVRNTLVTAMIETIVSGVGQREPSAEEVAAFYEENRDFFRPTDRYWVRQLRFPVAADGGEPEEEAARDRAARAAARLRGGEALADVARELSAGAALPLPDGPLPVSKLREYLGPTPTAAATRLAPGEVSDPVRSGSAYHVLQLVDRVASPRLPIDAVESQVRAEMRRRAGDASLRAYLDRLREDADVRLPPS